MIGKNKEFRRGLLVLLTAGAAATAMAFSFGVPCGLVCGLAWLTAGGVYYFTEKSRYRQLQTISADLENLLQRGTPLPLENYNEGELSILSCQIQKIALRLTEAAQTVNAEKQHLANSLADISHQLRTPLTAMNLTASMLGTRDLAHARRLVLVQELRDLLSRTDWLVESLLKLSKLDAGTVTMAAEPVRLDALIARAAEPLAIPMELREQTLKVTCGGETFTGDLVWAAEALGNCLKNCVEHTPIGGSISVTAQETALYTQITVEDTGPGFDMEDMLHLFDRFYKGKNASQSSYGIGLALARRVITAQDGTIQATNGQHGAKFIIKFYKQTI